MFYEPPKNNHGLRHNPMKALVVPRPIGWISTMSAAGEVNLSPYSFFNLLSVQPDTVGFSSEGRKDALTFAEETGEFVCSLATWDLRQAIHETAAPLPRGENEMTQAGLEAAPSRLVRPPRVKDSPVALECRWLKSVPLDPLGGGDARYTFVLGQVVGVHIDDAFIRDGLVDSAAMQPIARGGYFEYFRADPSTRFGIERHGYAKA